MTTTDVQNGPTTTTNGGGGGRGAFGPRLRRLCHDNFPALSILLNCGYNFGMLMGDLVAGLTVVLTVIPQGIGYMPLAGLELQVNILNP